MQTCNKGGSGYNFRVAHTLHEVDEETDVGAYQAYLRAQTDADLNDIAGRIDSERYPARREAAQRELRRRRIVSLPGYTSNEYAIRYVALAALILAGLTLVLALVMTGADAAEPAVPDGIPEGATLSVIVHLYGVALLRAIIVWSVRLGLYPVAWITLAWWTISHGLRLRRNQARADVWRLTALAWLVLSAVVLFASSSESVLPDVLASRGSGVMTFFNPIHPVDAL